MKLPKQKILISGYNGFIGNYLLNKFKAKGIPRELLYNPEKLNEFVKGYDTIIHCASYGNMSWQTDIPSMFVANVFSTINLLEACRLSGVKNFINIGTSSEYGNKIKPMVEDMLPEAKTMYGCTKVCGTYLTRHYSNYLNTVTVRPFSVYGEKEDDRRFIPTIIRCTSNNKRLKLYDGNHDWIHIDDFYKAIEVIVNNSLVLNGSVINVGSGISFSNEEVLQTMEQVIGHSIEAEKIPSKPNDSKNWVSGSNRLKAFGWKPRISLYDGLKRVYNYKIVNSEINKINFTALIYNVCGTI